MNESRILIDPIACLSNHNIERYVLFNNLLTLIFYQIMLDIIFIICSFFTRDSSATSFIYPFTSPKIDSNSDITNLDTFPITCLHDIYFICLFIDNVYVCRHISVNILVIYNANFFFNVDNIFV